MSVPIAATFLVPILFVALSTDTHGAARDTPSAPKLRIDGLYHGVNRPIRAVVEGETTAPLTLRLVASNGDLRAAVPMQPGKSIDLAAALPSLNEIEVAHWLQLTSGEEAIGTPWVAQPLISRPLTRTTTALRPDGTTSYTRIIGWGDRLLEPDNADYVKLKETWPKPDPTPRSGLRIYLDRDVVLHTDKGDVRIALAPEYAPNTAWNFRSLAEGGMYEHTPFHRVVKFDREGRSFVIQGGDPTGTGDGAAGYDLPLEPSSLAHDFGVVSMARNDTPDSAGSQFFVCLSREGTARLDNQYCAFGWAVSGADTILAIADGEIADLATGRPKEPVLVREAELVPAPPRTPGKGRPDARVVRPAGNAAKPDNTKPAEPDR
ncbi:MAG: peptidylprolyl isomerase [Phycisphaerae bacterium]|nr:peptidylprolyl isomerase [Phycisphaerae bacterium]